MIDAIYPVLESQVCFPVYLSGVGIADPEYHTFRDQGLISHQILLSLEGEGVVKVDGKTYRCKEGSVFYVASGVVHEYYPLHKDAWKTGWVVFRGQYIHQLMTELGFGDYFCKRPAQFDALKRTFLHLLAEAKDKNPVEKEERCALLVYRYIMELRRYALLNVAADETSVISRAKKYINAQYAQDISLEDLAQVCGVTKQHVCRIFKVETGMRPMEYLAKQRMAVAKVLLLDEKARIAEIGRAVGYEDPTYFGVVFKKYEGMSPSRYRIYHN